MIRLRSAMPVLVATLLAGCGRPTEQEPVEPNTRSGPVNNPPVRNRPERPAGSLPTFVDVAGKWGGEFERYDDQRGRHRIVEVNGRGVAILDFDLDGRPDLLFTNGCRLPPDDDEGQHPSVLLRNAGGDVPHFEDVAALARIERNGFAHGCAVGDFNEDGLPDLAITAYGPNRLWENNGDGTFSPVSLPGPNDDWSSSAAFGDLDGDGRLDLYFVNYVDAAVDPPRLCPNTAHPDGFLHCPPTVFDAVRDVLLVNDGVGGFEDATERAEIEEADGKGLGVAILDVDRNGALDLYVANDGMPNHLYLGNVVDDVNAPPFRENGLEFGVALNRNGEAEASMGVATGDIDRDGWTDLFVTHFFAETNTLYTNVDGEFFADATATSRLGPPSLRDLGFGTAFVDWDNDGWLDLVVANGHVDDFEAIDASEPYAMRPQAFRNERNGRFVEVTDWAGPGFAQPRVGRGLATGDLDRDGRVDIVISNQRSRSVILRNETAEAHPSISIRLVGSGRSPRTPVGTRVTVELDDGTQHHELVGGGSYQSASEQRIHIGLGSSSRAQRLRVEWPNGEEPDEFDDVGPGRYLLVSGRRLLREPPSPP